MRGPTGFAINERFENPCTAAYVILETAKGESDWVDEENVDEENVDDVKHKKLTCCGIPKTMNASFLPVLTRETRRIAMGVPMPIVDYS